MSYNKTYNELISKITKAKTAYYQNGRSELSDEEYDRLVSQAEKLGYIETVGATPVDNIEKITHEHPMLSLDKCHTVAEIRKFMGNKDVVAMWKADGLTISATYDDGALVRLETRGDGNIGNNIMHHAKSIENLPLNIDKIGRYVIDGECIILQNDFEIINSKLADSEKYSHARNLAAGSLNLLDNTISAKRHLRFYAWDVIEGGGNSLCENLLDAEELGFDVVTFNLVKSAIDGTIQFVIDNLRETAKLTSFPIDGIVFKYDDLVYGRSLGMTSHHPKFATAFKFEDETYETTLKNIEWQVGKSGQITPVGVFEPVDIAGVMVEKASLHNISIMKKLGLTNNCTVYIKRANDVIPQIDSADPDGIGEIGIPNICPICGSTTMIRKDNSSEMLYCTNNDCPGVLLGKWETFVGKKGMDIAGLSSATLITLLKKGYLTNMMESIYHLADYKKELYRLDGFGKKSIDNILAAIEDGKSIDLVHFITAFSIPGIGEGQSKLIASKYKTFEEFSTACDNQERFDTIPGIGKVLHLNIINWWVNNHFQMLDVAQHVRFKNDNFMNPPENASNISGMIFVVTGTVEKFKNRSELTRKIESLGGKVVGSVSKNTDYLINNDSESSSSKNAKAKSLGIPIISEDDFLKMIS